MSQLARPQPSQLLTVEEAAAYIHSTVRINTIYAAISCGSLNATKIGRRYYINTEEIERFINCQENASQPDSTSGMMMGHGSSLMAENITGQDMAMAAVSKLSRH
ncbi:helix-turn-helix domain-containing protein [bacterium]|nr:helix-turn-helix domain-containing protein [bacterium]